jgi:archaellum component FlaG (FlaF/FlaG flagellin family)
MQKLRDNPDEAKRIYKELVVQMENGMASEQAQQECIVIDYDDEESEATTDEKETTAFYIEHASDYGILEQNAMDATDSYDDSINALIDGNISDEDF